MMRMISQKKASFSSIRVLAAKPAVNHFDDVAGDVVTHAEAATADTIPSLSCWYGSEFPDGVTEAGVARAGLENCKHLGQALRQVGVPASEFLKEAVKARRGLNDEAAIHFRRRVGCLLEGWVMARSSSSSVTTG